MSGFKELIKSFPKSREYVRDFFVYGFKTREEFRGKSPRTYDNERRRLESWLGPYVQKDYAADGFNISLAIDSNLLDENPLFQVWKTKSFTDNDIVLHFFILDLLQGGRALTAEEITDQLLAEYDVLFDSQTVRRKCNAYVKEGLLAREKDGKKIKYSLGLPLPEQILDTEGILDALSFYQMAEVFGIIGNGLLGQFDAANELFRVKHSFFVHTLEDEILLSLLEAMRAARAVEVTIQSNQGKTPTFSRCIPLQIFTSTRTGRRFLCAYSKRNRRFTCFRLDSIKTVTPLDVAEDYDILVDKLRQNRKHLWGVSFQSIDGKHLHKLTMKIHVQEPEENYIVQRLEMEGRGGCVTKAGPGVYQYENEVFDCNEMMPWIRTFIGRILSLECTAKSVEQRFYRDLQEMYRIYGIEDQK